METEAPKIFPVIDGQMNKQIAGIYGLLTDLILPDHCSVCGKSLILQRNSSDSRIPLCAECHLTVNNSIFSLNYPGIRRCNTCGYPLTSEDKICSRCREKNWNFTSAVSIFLYSGIIKELIQAYKFDNRKNLSFYFASTIFKIYSKNFSHYIIVPVPFRPSSRRKRGWDQIHLICRILESKYKLPVSYCLSRKNGPAQKTMNFSQRFLNLKDKIKTNSRIIPQKALLLDDVFTTGATMDCCAEILVKSGCEDVCCLALALDL